MDINDITNNIKAATAKLQEADFFERDYTAVTADIDELDNNLHNLVRLLRAYARSVRVKEEDENVLDNS